jgi:hypothetical protein
MGARAVRWNCARCEVSVGRLDGESSDLPETWSRSLDLTYCLSCSRALAAEAASDSAPDSISREDRVRLRRRALIAFEIGRSPAAPDRTIANSCRTSSKTVATVRGELTADPTADDRAEQRVALG